MGHTPGQRQQMQLRGKTTYWYQDIHSEVSYSKHESPANQRQLEFIASMPTEFPETEYTYGMAREVIRNLAKLRGTDERYLGLIAKADEKKAAIAEYKRGKRKKEAPEPIKTGKYYDMAAPETVVEQNQAVAIEDSGLDNFQDDEEDETAFWDTIKAKQQALFAESV
jgi:hypothetical protein